MPFSSNDWLEVGNRRGGLAMDCTDGRPLLVAERGERVGERVRLRRFRVRVGSYSRDNRKRRAAVESSENRTSDSWGRVSRSC